MRRIVAAFFAFAAIIVVLVLVNGDSTQTLVTVPDVVGKTYDEGIAALEESGFRVVTVGPGCYSGFESLAPGSMVVSRIRRGDTGVQGGFDTAPRGTELGLDAGVVGAGTTVCLAATPKRLDWAPIVGLLWGTGALVSSFLAGRDMRRRGENGGVWGIIVFLLFPFGVLLWFVVRENKPVISAAGAEMRRDAEAFSPFESSDRG